MPSPDNCLPVYGPDSDLLYLAPIATVPRLIESGRVRALGTRRRIRALVAVCDSEELLALDRPFAGVAFIHDNETETNPRGVWTFRRVDYGD